MLSSRPFLVEAIFEWIIENNQTPFMMIDTTVEGVCAPPQHIVDDEIVLNLSADAISHFVMNREYIQFKARFSGRLEEIYAPMEAIKAVYAKETMSGIGFTPEEGAPYFAGDLTGDPMSVDESEHKMEVVTTSESVKTAKEPRKNPPHLKLVE